MPALPSPFPALLNETDIRLSDLRDAMLQILTYQKQEIDEIDMMGDPISYINAMDIHNVNLAFTQQFVSWLELHQLGLV